jgi:hypothetical protein
MPVGINHNQPCPVQFDSGNGFGKLGPPLPYPIRILVMVTVIPLHLRYTAANSIDLDIAKRTRWLKDVVNGAGQTQVMVGSADISWEHRHNEDYYQLHWHLAMWTKNPQKLQKQLLRVFPPKNKYDRLSRVWLANATNADQIAAGLPQ